MSQVTIRELDEGTVESLKTRAKKNGRSLEGELRLILRDAANQEKLSNTESLEISRRMLARFGDRTLPDSADLLREDRDSR